MLGLFEWTRKYSSVEQMMVNDEIKRISVTESPCSKLSHISIFKETVAIFTQVNFIVL